MTASDYIQIAIATVAGVAAILTGINIWFTNKQVKLQKKQWEFSYIPIFQFVRSEAFNKNDRSFLINNINNVYHEITEITFSSEDITISEAFNGTIKDVSANGNEVSYSNEAHGILVTLVPSNNLYHEGYLQIVGNDALGNEFKVKSQKIIFKNYKLINHRELSKTYLKKI